MSNQNVCERDEKILLTCINSMKTVLNEICTPNSDSCIDKLILSQCLNQLIVEYMHIQNRSVNSIFSEAI